MPKELLIVADRKEKECRYIEREIARGLSDGSRVPHHEVSRLFDAARSRKRYRIRFFNTEDGMKLRLTGFGQETKHMGSKQHCALCGNNSTSASWRGHRPSFQCSISLVHLCVRLHHGFRKEYLDYLAHAEKLEERVTTAISKSRGTDRTSRSSTGTAERTAADASLNVTNMFDS
jgi:hypothetical protein